MKATESAVSCGLSVLGCIATSVEKSIAVVLRELFLLSNLTVYNFRNFS